MQSSGFRLLFCPGIPRSGTSYLFVHLARHNADKINMPKTKESRMFMEKNLQEIFFSYYGDNPSLEKFFLESTPTYLSIAGGLPIDHFINFPAREKKVIINLRAPVEQIFAHYMHDVKAHISMLEGKTASYSFFHPAVLKKYLYPRSQNIKKLVNHIGINNIFVIKYPLDIRDPKALEARLSQFLGVSLDGFTNEGVGRGGWIPHYVYGGAEGIEVSACDSLFRVPPRGLLCFNGDMSRLWTDVTAEVASDVIAHSGSWCRQLPADTCRALRAATEPDWRETLKLLDLDDSDFPEASTYEARPALLEGAALDALVAAESVSDRLESIQRRIAIEIEGRSTGWPRA